VATYTSEVPGFLGGASVVGMGTGFREQKCISDHGERVRGIKPKDEKRQFVGLREGTQMTQIFYDLHG
jgi:hypothetical protein